jgi:hypothetical protein
MKREDIGKRYKDIIFWIIPAIVIISLFFSSCHNRDKEYKTFADYPGVRDYYRGKCTEIDKPVSAEDKRLLYKFRPRIIIPPGGRYPVNFYLEYLPYTVMRSYADNSVFTENVTREVLKKNMHNKDVYLDFQFDRFLQAGLDRKYYEHDPFDSKKDSVIYGRVYRESVKLPCGKKIECVRNLTFLKYNIIFSVSGLPAKLPLGYDFFLNFFNLNTEDWHELDNFTAVHIVLDETEHPIAVILAQHEYHRTYLIGKHVQLPPDNRITIDIALRSNEAYLGSKDMLPVEHRAIRWNYNLKYLLSGKDRPLIRGYDITYGINTGGKEIQYTLAFLSPCDPFYTAEIMLGEPRYLFGFDIGRNGPPGADFYATPELLPLYNLMKFYYLEDNNPDDINLIDSAIDPDNRTIDYKKIIEYGGAKLYRDLLYLQKGT